MNDSKFTSPKERHTPIVETLGPVTKPKKLRIRAKYMVLLAGLLLVAGVFSGNYILRADKNDGKQLAIQTETDLPKPAPTIQPRETIPDNQTVEPAPKEKEHDKKSPNIQKPIVVFEPEASINKKEKAELTKMLIEPMIAHQPGVFATIHIEIFSQDKFVGGVSDDKYIITTIGIDGNGNGEFLFGSKKNGLSMWTPECLDACPSVN